MKKISITLMFCIIIHAISIAQIKKEDYTESKKSGRFITLRDNNPVKDNQMYEETVSATSDGGTSTLLTVGNGNTPQRVSFTNSSIANSQIKVYPNPVNNYWIVETDLEEEGNKLVFSLYDFTGREVKKDDTISPKGMVKIFKGQLYSGIYFYTISTNSNIISSGKILIE